MRASILLGAVLPAFALADGYGYGGGAQWSASSVASAPPADHIPSQVTLTSTSTSTGTKTNTLTVFMTRPATSSIVVSKVISSALPTFTKPTQVAAATTSSGPAQVTQNAAPRGAVDAAMAGVVGAALYLVL